jgi:hypothetical protein
MLEPVKNAIKNQIPCPACYALNPVVDGASETIKAVLQSKVKNLDARVVVLRTMLREQKSQPLFVQQTEMMQARPTTG